MSKLSKNAKKLLRKHVRSQHMILRHDNIVISNMPSNVGKVLKVKMNKYSIIARPMPLLGHTTPNTEIGIS